jgi:hypothetical protein
MVPTSFEESAKGEPNFKGHVVDWKLIFVKRPDKNGVKLLAFDGTARVNFHQATALAAGVFPSGGILSSPADRSYLHSEGD